MSAVLLPFPPRQGDQAPTCLLSLPPLSAGKVIKPDTFLNLRDEGMPVHGRPYMKGNMYVHFIVEFPTTLDEAVITQLRKVLPIGPPAASSETDMDSDDTHEVGGATECMERGRGAWVGG